MAFQSPPSHSCVASERKMKSPSDTIERDHEHNPPLSSCPIHSSHGNLIQREPSITELDRIQRLRREHNERRNAELQSSSVMDKLRNAYNAFPTMELGYIDGGFSSPPPNLDQADQDGNMFRRPSQGTRTRKRREVTVGAERDLGTTRAKRAPAPKLRIRPYQNVFNQDNDRESAPKIILHARDEDGGVGKFGDVFSSPHSNKLVLKFPNAPLEELTLDDADNVPDDEDDFDISYQYQFQKPIAFELEHHPAPPLEEASIPVNSPTSLRTVHSEGDIHKLYSQDNKSQDSAFSPSNDTVSTTASPLPTKRLRYRNKKITLKPKKRTLEGIGRKKSIEAYVDFSDEDDAPSPSSQSSASVASAPCAIGETRSLNEMANALNIHGHSSRKTKHAQTLFGTDKNNGKSAFLSLRPKSLEVAKMTATCAVEHGDVVMELDPNLGSSRDLSAEDKSQKIENDNFTGHRSRSPSVCFIGDFSGGNIARGRTESHDSVQSQIEMAREAAARFGGLSDRCESLDSIISPNLSESNFRTPNPSSGKGRKSPQEDEKHKMIGLFLPKFEDDLSGSAPTFSGLTTKRRSNSFFDMMKHAFSPPS